MADFSKYSHFNKVIKYLLSCIQPSFCQNIIYSKYYLLKNSIIYSQIIFWELSVGSFNAQGLKRKLYESTWSSSDVYSAAKPLYIPRCNQISICSQWPFMNQWLSPGFPILLPPEIPTLSRKVDSEKLQSYK